MTLLFFISTNTFAAEIADFNQGVFEKLDIPCIGRITLPNGQHVYASCDRRFMFRGQFIDLWMGTKAGVDSSKNMVNLNRNNVDPDRISLHVGAKSKTKPQLTLIVSPDSEDSHRLLELALGKESSDFRYRVILLPSTYAASRAVNEAIWCAEDPRLALKQHFVHRRSLRDVAVKKQCDTSPLSLAFSASHLFGIARLPAIVMPDNQMLFGVPFSFHDLFKIKAKS